MGCDIHCFVEKKVKSSWKLVEKLEVGRNYTLFGKMAGVRDRSVEPISEPRHLPDDISDELEKLYTESYREWCFSVSWLSSAEMKKVRGWARVALADDGFKYWDDALFSQVKSPDTRLVFWFD